MMPESLPNWLQIYLFAMGVLATLVSISLGLFTLIPKLRYLKIKVQKCLARKLKYRKLKKAAIASDIESPINEIVASLQNELPIGWIRRAKIDWVEEMPREEFNDGEMILCLRPLENQDSNLLSGIYTFFTKALFPGVRQMIPGDAHKAAALQISRRTITEKTPYLLSIFEDEFLETAAREEPTVVTYLERYEALDGHGFFTGTFIREIYEIATRVRFRDLRNKMDQEIDAILSHIEGFLAEFQKQKQIPPGGWYRMGPATSYSFMLVARPDHRGTAPYVNRAKEKAQQGIERLYIMGTRDQKSFVRKVISRIEKIPEFELKDLFVLNKDYRGITGGLGALFVKKAPRSQAINQSFSGEITIEE